MKINDLRRIIQEELTSILAEKNAPAKEKETIEAPLLLNRVLLQNVEDLINPLLV